MTEQRFWSGYVKPALHAPQLGRVAWKVGTSTRAGIPDVCFRSYHRVAWLELKRLAEWPKRDTTPLRLGLSAEQRAHLREWCGAGRGHGFVVALISETCCVFDWNVPDPLQPENLKEVLLAELPLKRVKPLLARTLAELMGRDQLRIDHGPVLPVLEGSYIEELT